MSAFERMQSLFANHFMIRNGLALLVIPERTVGEFRKLLVAYYEDGDPGEIAAFLKDRFWRKI